MLTGHDIRHHFLEYFARHGHRIVKSSPVLPPDDTLLFANAGMNQFKDVFTGLETREYTRATSSQKCIRAGGKHNDLDEVGKTARHHTFFEMLGNFSFGDYFKEEAIAFAWELLLREFELPLERLWFTVYEDDDEAFALWKRVGAPEDRILRFGKKENFWQMGDTGPCGPCSEIHYFLGDDPADNLPQHVNGPGDTTVEIWNLVFMQFERSADGTLKPLPKPSVDTGAGLERLASVLQGKKTNYDTDLIFPIIAQIAARAGREYTYDSPDGISMRVIADHARATAFSIADGIYPGNTGRNYVLRKIMRRAIWHGRRLGIETPFLHDITAFVIDHMAVAFPELQTQADVIARVVATEEKLFSSTLAAGRKRLDEAFQHAADGVVAGADVFDLYQTYGLPVDLIAYIAEQRGLRVDEAGFEAALDEERARARESWKGGAAKAVAPAYQAALDGKPTVFRGYDHLTLADLRVRAVIRQGEIVDALRAGEVGEVVLDETPFYAASGGQVGDTGLLENEATTLRVTDTVTPVTGLTAHRVEVLRGEVRPADRVTATVDAERRRRTMLNHSATHLLHAALREVLGAHVKQAGSEVAPDKLRFDFTHYAALSADELAEIERLVNAQIRRNASLAKREMPLDAAVAAGAMALFGEKYGDVVRVVEVPGFSMELCGGTHVTATGDIGLFKIVSESSIASGVRRIVAVTGEAAFERFQTDEAILGELAETFRLGDVGELPAQIGKLQTTLRQAEREIETLKLKLAQERAESALAEARPIGDLRVLALEATDLDKSGVRQLAEHLVGKLGRGVVVIGLRGGEKVSLAVRVADALTNQLKAGHIVRELATIVGGGGGGRADFAEAGGKDPAKLTDALQAAPTIVERFLG
ncbi:MAG: alanine--tRNA ligase [Chloracidobacterium sp.]|uniref:Alanine--tRNA ligase n=1 Tax=Chloracidobacterium validum TaxID=2821543 RepID=A0ABX8B7F8_9BACT|nr:alanine--tRNA ligase [Chloracidobacterium validum]QUW02887.1 alanine--tRNA ligase [Chloracidobacterium validum]